MAADSAFRAQQRYDRGERRPKALVVITNGPFGWGRHCPWCNFAITHRKQRGGGNQWGNVARANAAVAEHITTAHADKLLKKES